MSTNRPDVAADLVAAWQDTRKGGWSRPLEPAEAEALLELIDELSGQVARINDAAVNLGNSLSRNMNRQDALTRLLYSLGYTSRPYDLHGIIATRRDPFVGSTCGQQTATVAKPTRHTSRKRKARR